MYSILMLLSADPLNYDICILQLNGLGGKYFYRHSGTAATGNLNKCGCEDIELIIHSGGCNRGNCAAQASSTAMATEMGPAVPPVGMAMLPPNTTL